MNKQSIFEHIEELRKRLLMCFACVCLCAIMSYFFVEQIYSFLTNPLKAALLERGQSMEMQYTQLYEVFTTYLKLSIFSGFILSLPFICYQIWKFVSPGLYVSEKNALFPFLFLANILFFAGACLVHFVALPVAIDFFLDFQVFDSDSPENIMNVVFRGKVSEYLSLLMVFILGFGVSFQLPLIVNLLCRAGIVSSSYLATKRKYAVVMILIIAAIVTPPDVISQFSLGVPLYLLYEASIFFSRKH